MSEVESKNSSFDEDDVSPVFIKDSATSRLDLDCERSCRTGGQKPSSSAIQTQLETTRREYKQDFKSGDVEGDQRPLYYTAAKSIDSCMVQVIENSVESSLESSSPVDGPRGRALSGKTKSWIHDAKTDRGRLLRQATEGACQGWDKTRFRSPDKTRYNNSDFPPDDTFKSRNCSPQCTEGKHEDKNSSEKYCDSTDVEVEDVIMNSEKIEQLRQKRLNRVLHKNSRKFQRSVSKPEMVGLGRSYAIIEENEMVSTSFEEEFVDKLCAEKHSDKKKTAPCDKNNLISRSISLASDLSKRKTT